MPLSRAGFSVYSSRGGRDEAVEQIPECMVMGSATGGAALAHHGAGEHSFPLLSDAVQLLSHGGKFRRDCHYVALNDADYYRGRDRSFGGISARPDRRDYGYYLECGHTTLAGYHHRSGGWRTGWPLQWLARHAFRAALSGGDVGDAGSLSGTGFCHPGQ